MTEKRQKIWTDEYEIRSYDADRKLKLKFSSLCRFMQNTAYNHAENLGVGFSFLHEKNLIWMLAGQIVKAARYPEWRDTVYLHTWPSSNDRIFYYRDFKMTDAEGQVLAAATTKWFIIDMIRRRPVRKGAIPEENFIYGEQLFGDGFDKIVIPEGKADGFSINAVYSDIDIYRHVNSARYIEWAMDAMPAEFTQSHELREIQADYLTEAVLGDVLVLKTFSGDGDFVHSIQRNEDGKVLCNVRSRWKC